MAVTQRPHTGLKGAPMEGASWEAPSREARAGRARQALNFPKDMNVHAETFRAHTEKTHFDQSLSSKSWTLNYHILMRTSR